jgi:hypothetical protein
VDRVAFGHHGTDACTSLLKAAFMYVDRWDSGNERYLPQNIRAIAESFGMEARRLRDQETRSKLIPQIHQLVQEYKATTDEPPRQKLLREGTRIIIRPLFDILETELIEVSEHMALPTEGSGCGHSLATSTYTPREIIQFQTLRQLEAEANIEFIQSWTRYALDTTGALKTNSRHRRNELLGPDYKPAAGQLDKY